MIHRYMKISVKELRDIVQEASGKIKASPAFLKKERVREKLQHVIEDAVENGDVMDQRSLEQLCSDMDMALKALKMVSYDVWVKKLGIDRA